MRYGAKRAVTGARISQNEKRSYTPV
jgi:hypothetical protein